MEPAPISADITRLDLSQIGILVVEDNVYMRKIIRMVLSAYGIRKIIEAEDGAQGLENFRTAGPDIILTDWLMPNVDGIEMTRTIRNGDVGGDQFVPIIMLTGKSTKREVIEARDAGVTEYLCKPFSAKALYLRMADAIVNPREFIRTSSYFGPDRRRHFDPLYSGPERRKEATDADLPA